MVFTNVLWSKAKNIFCSLAEKSIFKTEKNVEKEHIL